MPETLHGRNTNATRGMTVADAKHQRATDTKPLGQHSAWGLVTSIRISAGLAVRNLLAHRSKTATIGGVVCTSTLALVLGSSLLSSTYSAMRSSITRSITGHLQVYSAHSKEDVDILGGVDYSVNLAPLDDFAAIRRLLRDIPNVAGVVPMALDTALISAGNPFERALGKLRLTVNERLAHNAHGALTHYENQKAHIQHLIRVLLTDAQNARGLGAEVKREQLAVLTDAASEGFWAGFDADPLGHLEHLDNRVAPLTGDPVTRGFRYVGTDPVAFQSVFDQMEVVDGVPIPAGERGFMFSKLVYEDQIKLPVARGLDKLQAALQSGRATIARDDELQRLVRDNVRAADELLLQLDAHQTGRFRERLQGLLGTDRQDVAELLRAFFQTDDHNFEERHRFFYERLAPDLQLYRAPVGDVLTLQALDRNGYVRSTSLKVYGTFRFKGLEDSPQAGAISLMDLVSFRELHGLAETEQAQEVAAMHARAGVRDVSRQDVESQLFAAPLARTPAPEASAEDVAARLTGLRVRRGEQSSATYPPERLQQGKVLSVGVTLRDESKLNETARAIEAAGARAGLPLKVATWQQAAGFVGQLALLIQALLVCAVIIVLIVGLVVANNSLVMAALERVQELGTLRAIGAQRRFVLGMVILECLILGIGAGALGGSGAGLILAALRHSGIPAGNEVMQFVFGGPRLFPTVGVTDYLVGFGTMLVVCLGSAMYPAWLGMRVSPRVAMQAEE